MSEKDIDNKQKKQNKTLTIFLATFIITFAFVAMAVKYFSPEIDVEFGKATEEEQAADEDKGSVDERLRWIQFEDNMPGVSTRFTDTSADTPFSCIFCVCDSIRILEGFSRFILLPP